MQRCSGDDEGSGVGMRLRSLLEALEDFQEPPQRKTEKLPGDASQPELAAKGSRLVELPCGELI